VTGGAAGPVPALARAAVDRVAVHRGDPAWLAAAWERAAVLVLDEHRQALAVGPAEAPRLLWRAPAELGSGLGAVPVEDRWFLGERGGTPYFAVVGELPPLGQGQRAVGLRDVGAALSDADAGLLVAAVALANWHAGHPRCPRCGTPTRAAQAGWVRRCPTDGSEHYPRVDPAIIVLVHDGADRCLLGRQAAWPPGRYSTLAGFVEPGESAESAVAREVTEETGVAVRELRYVASQPWPFPSSLMLGFTARADYDGRDRVDVDGDELEDARWFTRAELTGDRGLILPPPVSIAYRLITGWLSAASG